MADDQWEVLLPAEIDPAGPRSIADFCTSTAMDAYETRDELRAAIGRFEAIIVRTDEIPAQLIEAAENLTIISKHGTGVDNIDLPAATAAGVLVANTPGANANAVAEHAISLLVASSKQLRTADMAVRSGGWQDEGKRNHELKDADLGLFGFGNIARLVAQKAVGLGMNVATYDPYISEDDVPASVDRVDSVVALFERADHISIHTPLTDETRHAISTRELASLPDHGIVVNTARGGVLDEEALIHAIEAESIGGAGLDVFAEEPVSTSNPLVDLDEVILTPHMGAVTVESMERMGRQAAANVRVAFEGGIPDTTLNPEALDR